MSVIGSSDNIVSRVKRLIPNRWFQYVAPYRDAVLGGLADSSAWLYGFIGYAKAQTRLSTAYGIWLDIFAFDFLGRTLIRSGANDATFRAIIRATILQERVTRAGMIDAVTKLVGAPPQMFEPWNPRDTGAYSSPRVSVPDLIVNVTGTSGGSGSGQIQLRVGDGTIASVDGFNSGDVVTITGVTGTLSANGNFTIEVSRVLPDNTGRIILIGTTAGSTDVYTGGGTVAKHFPPRRKQYGSMGYGVGRGGYGNMGLPGQVFMKIMRTTPSGVPNVGGYGNTVEGYGVGQAEYIGSTTELEGVTDAMIYQLISMTKPTGTTCWVAFTLPPVLSGPSLDFSKSDNSQYVPVI